MKNKLLLSVALSLLCVNAWATTSTINPAVPAQGSPLSSATLRANFLAAYNDINALWTAAASGVTSFVGDITASITGGVATTTVSKIQGTTVSGTTGTGNVVFSSGATLVSPALGTPSALNGANITGTAPSLTAGNVTTNAPLTGPITSSGNVTSITSQTGTGTQFVMSASPTVTGTMNGAAVVWSGVNTALNYSATGTGANTLPVGTTGQAPSAANGMARYDNTLNKFRVAISNVWQSVFTTADTIPLANGGTGASIASTALANLAGAPIYYAKNYGMVCDGQYINVTTTASTAAIVSTHTFTSADVGKMISVPYAAAVTITGNTHTTTTLDTLSTTQPRFVGQPVIGTGIPANTTISNIISTTSVQLSQPATGTATGVSITFGYPLNTTISTVAAGAATLTVAPTISLTSSSMLTPAGNAAAFGTGDSTAFNSLISMVTAAGGGKIILPATCILDATVTWASNISLVGDGDDVSGVKYISTSDLINNILQGPGTSGTHMVANTFKDFFIDGWSATQATYNVFGKGMNMPYAEGFYANNVHVYGTPATCMANDFPLTVVKQANKLVRCGRLASAQIGGNGIGDGISSAVIGEIDVATENIVIDPTNYALFLEAQTATAAAVQGSFTNNHVFQSLNPPTNSNGSAGLANSGGIGFVINNNTVTCTGLPSLYAGIGVTPGTTAQTSGTQTVISGNSVTGCFRGVVVDYIVNALPNGIPSKIKITNNQLVGQGVSSFNSSDGIYIRPNASQTMDTLDISDNDISLFGRCGTIVTGTGTLTNLTLNGNHISNNSSTNVTSQFQSGVCFNATVTGLMMAANDIFDNHNSTQKYGVSISSGITVSGAVLSSNNMDGNATSPTNFAGTFTGTDLYTTNSGAVSIGTTSAVTGSILTLAGHLGFSTSIPTVSACGSGTLVTGSTDNKFTITGVTAATSCTVTFGTALPTAPACSFNSSTGIAVGGVPTTAAVTTTMALFTGTLQGICF